MHSLVPSVRRDVVLVQACGSSRNRWSHYYYYGVIGTSSTSELGMYLVLRYGEILRFAETCSRPRFLHPRGDSTARVLSVSLCVKIPLSRDSGLISRNYFLLASKLLRVYQAIMYPTVFLL